MRRWILDMFEISMFGICPFEKLEIIKGQREILEMYIISESKDWGANPEVCQLLSICIKIYHLSFPFTKKCGLLITVNLIFQSVCNSS